MTVEISPEAYQTLQQRVDEGQFTSIEDALNGSIFEAAALTQGSHDPAYLEYLDESIDAGLRSAEEHPLVPLEEVLQDLRKRETTAA